MNGSFVILFSGGFDSYVTTEYIIQKYKPEKIKLLNIHYGQVNDVELFAAKRLFEHLKQKYRELDLEFQRFLIPQELINQLFNTSALVNKQIDQTDFERDKQPTTYVPFRNLLFLTFAAIIAENEGYKYIGSGIQPHTEYYYWDATEDFVLRVNSLFNLNPKHIQVIAPFKNKTKEAIFKIARDELKLTDYELSLTWSCYNPVLDEIEYDELKGKINSLLFVQCGVCGSCIERLEAKIPSSLPISIPYNTQKHQELILTYLLDRKMEY
jgi:7-cyano-7-deazaguanine synthase